MKQYLISKASGSVAWEVARKFSETNNCDVVYRQGEKLICHSPKSYREGKPGDYGFCDETSRHAMENKGIWLVVGSAGWGKAKKAIAKSNAARALRSIPSEKRAAASRDNGKKGGYPKGRPRGNKLTPLQRQAHELHQQGLTVREIATQMGRQPENIRQLVARAATKIRKSEEV